MFARWIYCTKTWPSTHMCHPVPDGYKSWWPWWLENEICNKSIRSARFCKASNHTGTNKGTEYFMWIKRTRCEISPEVGWVAVRWEFMRVRLGLDQDMIYVWRCLCQADLLRAICFGEWLHLLLCVMALGEMLQWFNYDNGNNVTSDKMQTRRVYALDNF